jgi:hypothetical protein
MLKTFVIITIASIDTTGENVIELGHRIKIFGELRLIFD